jgi:hypothetical protein
MRQTEMPTVTYTSDGGAVDAPSEGGCLADRFEQDRQRSLRLPYPMLLLDAAGLDWLDRVDPAALPGAADAILLAQTARQAIRAAARLEHAWKTNSRGGCGAEAVPADELVAIMTRERDRAIEAHYGLRRRQAGLKRLEAVNHRIPKRIEAEAPVPVQVPFTPAFARFPVEKGIHAASAAASQ